LIDRAFLTSKAVNDSAKNYWNTKRPYLMDKNIKALIKPHNNKSYPSGHTSSSYVAAHLLGLLIPEKRNQFYNRAAEIANHRILVGMHYPKDVEGGKEMALLIVGAFLENDQFAGRQI
jgi:acid phosphatase (class A)